MKLKTKLLEIKGNFQRHRKRKKAIKSMQIEVSRLELDETTLGSLMQRLDCTRKIELYNILIRPEIEEGGRVARTVEEMHRAQLFYLPIGNDIQRIENFINFLKGVESRLKISMKQQELPDPLDF